MGKEKIEIRINPFSVLMTLIAILLPILKAFNVGFLANCSWWWVTILWWGPWVFILGIGIIAALIYLLIIGVKALFK